MRSSKTDKQMAIDLVLEHCGDVKREINDAREAALKKFTDEVEASAAVQKLWEKWKTARAETTSLEEAMNKSRAHEVEVAQALRGYGFSIKEQYSWSDRHRCETGGLPRLDSIDVDVACSVKRKFDDSFYRAKLEAIDTVEREARTAIITAGAAEFGLIIAEAIKKFRIAAGK